jgi:hypothetical protein
LLIVHRTLLEQSLVNRWLHAHAKFHGRASTLLHDFLRYIPTLSIDHVEGME